MSPIRRLAALAAAVLTATLLIGAAGPAQAHGGKTVTLPLRGSFVGHFTTVTPPPQLTLDDFGTGHATVLGRFTARMTVLIDFDHPVNADGDLPVVKSGFLQTVSGDRVFMDLTGVFDISEGVGIEFFTITGGTGRFRGASGSGDYTVPPPTFLDPDTGNGFGPEIFDGVINLPRR
jgi:hypothetical protein